uniref:Secreted protein n=1 Tax=Streptomyces sp. NBC_01401 TaxID=2903854 RepID=A0AAU3GPR7_9ACTN
MRAAAVRFVLAILMGLLLTPHSGTASADARTTSAPAMRAATLPNATVGEAHGEYGTCGTSDRGGEANGLPRHRHRSATAPDAPSRSAAAAALCGMCAPAAAAAPGNARRAPRSSAAHSSSALQVFRC